MNQLILVGAGGCMRELLWQIEEQNKCSETWEVLGFVDEKKPTEEVYAGDTHCPYLGNDAWLLAADTPINAAVCVGSVKLRRKIIKKLKQNKNISFPNIILENTKICSDVKMGEGCIVSMDSRISTNVTLGDFVFLNMGVRICHDGKIGDFCTLAPEVTLAGNVEIGADSEIGLGTKIIQGIKIGRNVTTGAGSVIVRDTEENCTVVGVPARTIKRIADV